MIDRCHACGAYSLAFSLPWLVCGLESVGKLPLIALAALAILPIIAGAYSGVISSRIIRMQRAIGLTEGQILTQRGDPVPAHH